MKDDSGGAVFGVEVVGQAQGETDVLFGVQEREHFALLFEIRAGRIAPREP